MTIPLGNDAVTAYRLPIKDGGGVSLAHMMACWNTIDPALRHGPEDLPEDMQKHNGPMGPWLVGMRD